MKTEERASFLERGETNMVLSFESNYERGPVVRRKFCMQNCTYTWMAIFLRRRKVRVQSSIQTTVSHRPRKRTWTNQKKKGPKKEKSRRKEPMTVA